MTRVFVFDNSVIDQVLNAILEGAHTFLDSRENYSNPEALESLQKMLNKPNLHELVNYSSLAFIKRGISIIKEESIKEVHKYAKDQNNVELFEFYNALNSLQSNIEFAKDNKEMFKEAYMGMIGSPQFAALEAYDGPRKTIGVLAKILRRIESMINEDRYNDAKSELMESFHHYFQNSAVLEKIRKKSFGMGVSGAGKIINDLLPLLENLECFFDFQAKTSVENALKEVHEKASRIPSIKKFYFEKANNLLTFFAKSDIESLDRTIYLGALLAIKDLMTYKYCDAKTVEYLEPIIGEAFQDFFLLLDTAIEKAMLNDPNYTPSGQEIIQNALDKNVFEDVTFTKNYRIVIMTFEGQHYRNFRHIIDYLEEKKKGIKRFEVFMDAAVEIMKDSSSQEGKNKNFDLMHPYLKHFSSENVDEVRECLIWIKAEKEFNEKFVEEGAARLKELVAGEIKKLDARIASVEEVEIDYALSVRSSPSVRSFLRLRTREHRSVLPSLYTREDREFYQTRKAISAFCEFTKTLKEISSEEIVEQDSFSEEVHQKAPRVFATPDFLDELSRALNKNESGGSQSEEEVIDSDKINDVRPATVQPFMDNRRLFTGNVENHPLYGGANKARKEEDEMNPDEQPPAGFNL